MAKKQGLIYVLDMESSLSDAVARRITDMGQYFVYRRWNMDIDFAKEAEAYKEVIKGIIITGSARNVNSKKVNKKPVMPAEMFLLGAPVLGICYGMQYLGHLEGTKVVRCWHEQDVNKRTKENSKKDKGEQGVTTFHSTDEGKNSVLFQGLGPTFPVWMKHNWMVQELPPEWTLLGRTDLCPVAAMQKGNLYALQFHPEPFHSLFGRIILNNFVESICQLDTPYF